MERRVDVRAAGGVDSGMDESVRTQVRRENDERRRRRGRPRGDVTKNALVRGREDVRRDPVFELVNGERQLRQQQDRRYPNEEPAAPDHARHRKSSSARFRISVK